MKNFTCTFLWITISCILFNSLQAAELTVSKTVPANQQKDVDPSLTEIIITFSASIKQNSWSFVTTEQGEFPEAIDDPYFPDTKTCILPVLLEPDKTYSLGINSPTRKGFKSATAETVTCVPYILTFHTAKGEEDEEALPEETVHPKKSAAAAAVKTAPASKSASSGHSTGSTLILRRVSEKQENAFSILVPDGWQTAGGIFRVDPTAQGGPSQSIAAKLDFAVQKDNQGSVMIRWLPDVLFYDASYSPAGQMGLFPPGSNYSGMTVYPVMSATQFIPQLVFPYAHPQAGNFQMIDQRPLPDLARKYQQRVLSAWAGSTFSYDAAVMTIRYLENGIQFTEKIFTVIENWGQLGTGMWGNKETFLIRTPADQLSEWEPVFSIIQNSVIINPQWLQGEIRGQMQRAQTVIQVQQDIQKIEQDIVQHRQKTNAEIHNDMFLTLTDQEEYVNPFTNQVEVGSNQWKHRWVNGSGDIIYSNDDSYDPKVDINLNRSDYQKTPVRKRFPQ